MPVYGTIDSLVEYTPRPASGYLQVQPPDEDRKPDGLENLLADKVTCLRDILDDIGRDIARRADLSRYVLYLISQHYCYLKTKLFELYRWQLGGTRSVEVRRIRLEQQLDTLNNEKRQELVTAWQDAAALKKEFRTWFKQYCDLAQRVSLLLPDSAKRTHPFLPLIQDDRKRTPADTLRQLPRRARGACQ